MESSVSNQFDPRGALSGNYASVYTDEHIEQLARFIRVLVTASNQSSTVSAYCEAALVNLPTDVDRRLHSFIMTETYRAENGLYPYSARNEIPYFKRNVTIEPSVISLVKDILERKDPFHIKRETA